MESRTRELHRLLTELNRRGGFSAAVLTDSQGLPIASASGAGVRPEAQAAVVALVQRTARQVGDRLGMAAADEIALFDQEGRRLVCRPFAVDERRMILGVLVPDRRLPYRRLTSQALRSAASILKSERE
jgi:predicted regulator of Ras-like GTPase activity (Roadblock/LC7/MglB family)